MLTEELDEYVLKSYADSTYALKSECDDKHMWMIDSDDKTMIQPSQDGVVNVKANTFIADNIKFANDTNKYVNDIAFSGEPSNSDKSLATSAFVRNCVYSGLSNYYTITECDNKFALKSAIPTNYVQKRTVPYHVKLTSGPTVTRANNKVSFTYTFDKPVMNGLFNIYNRIPATNEMYHYVLQITNGTSTHSQFTISNNVCKLTVGDDGDVVDYYDASNLTSSDQVDAEFVDTHMLSAYVTKQELWSNYLNQKECVYKFASKNTTITHYAPIDDGEIDEFIVGKPVFMSGYVYKQSGSEWIESTVDDTQDCICSVKSNGTWREYVGIIVSVDSENDFLTFASHGDMLFNVDDSSKYNIGDVVLYDGSVVDDDMPITVKIQQSIAGKVSGKIDEHTIALFKD